MTPIEYKRGYAAIGLDRCKNPLNLGSVLRAAGCYSVSMVAVSGMRAGKAATDTMKAYRHIPTIEVDTIMDAMPFGAVPVVVELSPRAVPLIDFVHPKSAFYIFGPEDGSVKAELVERIKHVVYIPTRGCMNLAATVNVLLYDRLAKESRL